MWGDVRFNQDDWSERKLLHLFNSQFGPKARGQITDYQRLHKALLLGAVDYQYVEVPCEPKPLAPDRGVRPSNEWQVFKRARHGGGDLHGWLKWWGYKWLTNLAQEPAEFEVRIPDYGCLDVYSRKMGLFLECGNTSPTHALRALTLDGCSSFVVLPFQRAAIQNTSGIPNHSLEAIRFILRHRLETNS